MPVRYVAAIGGSSPRRAVYFPGSDFFGHNRLTRPVLPQLKHLPASMCSFTYFGVMPRMSGKPRGTYGELDDSVPPVWR